MILKRMIGVRGIIAEPRSVELKLLKPFADLKAGDVAYFEAALADRLILDDAAEFVEDDAFLDSSNVLFGILMYGTKSSKIDLESV